MEGCWTLLQAPGKLCWCPRGLPAGASQRVPVGALCRELRVSEAVPRLLHPLFFCRSWAEQEVMPPLEEEENPVVLKSSSLLGIKLTGHQAAP